MRWFGIAAVVFIGLIIWQGYVLYAEILDKPSMETEQAIKTARSEAHIVSVEEVYHFHGDLAYTVILGKDRDDSEKYVWVPEKEGKEITIREKSSGASKQEIRTKIKQEEQPKEIKAIKPGIKTNEDGKDKLVWEATYIDKDNRYVISYHNFSNGEYWRKHSLKQ
ncbi:DUF5590 domain-containing protein [Pseudalkalibacillus caeni]|uniref:Cell wall elongation regulator TseB-like domain-containing protein n=1 Tax=Exobacillus caeni TaxID=2574798 RepID=A0A5R9EX83_9BACL|nr:DUF5590 domain-containing protein [Pseudalkalibacillus caeni]TLS35882.1 hypothetical protein FCL54_17955 [Pseudalkalibacillus caeni]